WVAPRGIVAAAVASVFALRLKERGVEAANRLVPVTLIVILLTVTVYGLTAPWVARRLGVAEAFPQGILFAGAASWVRKLALLLQREGIRVMLVDTNRAHIREARMAGLPTYAGSVLGEFTLDRIDFGGLGRLLAVTPNDWVNILAVRRFERIFGRKECYQLPPHHETDKPGARYAHLHGRLAFGERCHAALLERRLREGFVFKATPLTETFDFETFRARYGPDTIVLFRRDGDGRLHVVTADEELRPQPGETLISLLREPEASNDSAP
ncbi:MAG: sodium:proton exchanger, partial [Planctomycetota bacterium]